MPGRIVLYGATGYMGGLTARAMVAGGARPILAGRDRAGWMRSLPGSRNRDRGNSRFQPDEGGA